MYKINAHILHTIQLLSKERYVYVNQQEESFDASIGEYGEYTVILEDKIDEFEDKIYNLLREFHNALPFDFVLEELTKLGHCPSLIYDDNGHWAIVTDGYQNVPESDKPDNIHITHYVYKEEWFDTINEAIVNYFKND